MTVSSAKIGRDESFGSELRRLRQDAGYSIAELAKKVHYSKGYLSKIETGNAHPNPALAELCDQEFNADGRLIALLPREEKHLPTGPHSRLSTLPAKTTYFIGRGEEVERLVSRLTTRGCTDANTGDVTGNLTRANDITRVCVIHGMAGSGKTAVATRCAHLLAEIFTDGCLFIDLRGYTEDTEKVSASAALDRLLRLLGVAGEQIPADVDDRAALYRERLRDKKFFIVLDNAHSTQELLPLIPDNPECSVLITSRHRLPALERGCRLPLSTLPEEDAAKLFRSLAADRLADQCDRPEQAATIAQIVRDCGLLPLTVRITAARLQANTHWGLSDLIDRLADHRDRLEILDDGERSVAATFALSYHNLPAEQQRLFALLSLHPGNDFDVYTAAALADDRLVAAEKSLEGLCAAHLLMQQADGRYQFHDLLRSFARDMANQALSHEQQRHAIRRLVDLHVYTADMIDQATAKHRYRRDIAFEQLPPVLPKFTDDKARSQWQQQEWPNLVSLVKLANTSGLHQRCWQLTFALRDFFFLAKLWDPWIEISQYAVSSAAADNDLWAQATAINNLGMALVDRGDFDQAAARYREALALYRQLNDEHGVTNALANSAWVDYYRGNYSAASDGLHAAVKFHRRANSPRNVAITLRGISLVETELGNNDAALRHAQQAWEICQEIGLEHDSAMALNCLGWAHFRAQRYPEATTAYRKAQAKSYECESRYEQARAETGLGNIAAAQGHRAEAEKHWQRAHTQHPKLDPRTLGEGRAQEQLQGQTQKPRVPEGPDGGGER